MTTSLKYSFAPAAQEGCTALILGSLPGDASLQAAQYYAHPRNAFWKIMGRVCGFSAELPYGERLKMLNNAGIALWDIVFSGARQGSLDSNIRDEKPNDIMALLQAYPTIRTICCNGGTAHRYLKRYFPALFVRQRWSVQLLPSTSPAAARLSFEEKLHAYQTALAPLLTESTLSHS